MFCYVLIEVGDVEYELWLRDVAVFVHTRCFIMWQRPAS